MLAPAGYLMLRAFHCLFLLEPGAFALGLLLLRFWLYFWGYVMHKYYHRSSHLIGSWMVSAMSLPESAIHLY